MFATVSKRSTESLKREVYYYKGCRVWHFKKKLSLKYKVSQNIDSLKEKTLTTFTAACTPSSFQSEVTTLELFLRKKLSNLESHSKLIILVHLKNGSNDEKGKTS